MLREISPSGALGAFYSWKRGWAIRDLRTGKTRRVLPKPTQKVLFLSDAALLYFEEGPNNGGGTSVQRVSRFDLQTGISQLIRSGKAPLSGYGDFLVASPSGRWVAGERHNHGQLWNVAQGWKGTIFQKGAPISWDAAAFSPSEKWLATRESGGKIVVRALKNDGEVGNSVAVGIHAPYEYGGADALAFSPDGRFLCSAGADGAVKFWEIAPAKNPSKPQLRLSIFNFPTENDETPQWLAMAPDGRWLASDGASKWASWRKIGASLEMPLLPLESHLARRDAKLLQELAR